MKAWIRAWFTILLLTGGSHAHGDQTSLTVGFHGGISNPIGDLGRFIGDGYHFGLSVEGPADLWHGAGVVGNYHRFEEKTHTEPVFGFPVTFRQDAELLEAALFVRIALVPRGLRGTPYLRAGIGASRVSGDLAIRTPAARARTRYSETYPTLHGGGGFAWRLNRASLLTLDFLYHAINEENEFSHHMTAALGLRAVGSPFPAP